MKTMEDVRIRIKLHLTTDDKSAIRQFSKPLFKQGREIDGLYLIEMMKDTVVMNKPIYVGTSILDLSKICMMRFHYEVIHKNLEGNYYVIFTDTDSLVYDIRHHDIYEWISQHREHFDLSDSQGSELQDDTNKKTSVKFKAETNSLVIKELIARSPKSYAYSYQKLRKELKPRRSQGCE